MRSVANRQGKLKGFAWRRAAAAALKRFASLCGWG
jgi:hypothetical protein